MPLMTQVALGSAVSFSNLSQYLRDGQDSCHEVIFLPSRRTCFDKKRDYNQ